MRQEEAKRDSEKAGQGADSPLAEAALRQAQDRRARGARGQVLGAEPTRKHERGEGDGGGDGENAEGEADDGAG